MANQILPNELLVENKDLKKLIIDSISGGFLRSKLGLPIWYKKFSVIQKLAEHHTEIWVRH